ncbi:DoxX family protein [Aurantimonas sp. MSK8Z-1]|uniref:DoxX family protein n=1 Tax=Mangrovibrevibacter kandeliae TaxID=2968473 RepID=UPI002118F206|nr:DoxX family protein [Aurantimonas sp. MSK8Z-1]MCW4114917.1 DoxX family protein [Aurantimonas sp. MSK8Z-1]
MISSRYTPYALAALRIVSGLLFLEHGTQKLLNFPIPGPGVELFSLLGVGGLIEIVGGVLIALGLFTRIAAFVCSGEMAVAYWLFHAPGGVFPAGNGGDAAILFCFAFLLIACTGPGALSLDSSRKSAIAV